MTRQPLLTVLTFGVAFATSVNLHSQTTASHSDPSMSRSELRRQIDAAHSPEEYRALALYFRQQEGRFRSKAAEEKAEWDRRKQGMTSVTSKYPTPADSARNLYDYYVYKATEMSAKAAEYEKKIETQPVSGKI